jgi:hypothetical protein
MSKTEKFADVILPDETDWIFANKAGRRGSLMTQSTGITRECKSPAG